VICRGRGTRSNLNLRRSHNDTPNPARWVCLIHRFRVDLGTYHRHGTVVTTTL